MQVFMLLWVTFPHIRHRFFDQGLSAPSSGALCGFRAGGGAGLALPSERLPSRIIRALRSAETGFSGGAWTAGAPPPGSPPSPRRSAAARSWSFSSLILSFSCSLAKTRSPPPPAPPPSSSWTALASSPRRSAPGSGPSSAAAAASKAATSPPPSPRLSNAGPASVRAPRAPPPSPPPEAPRSLSCSRALARRAASPGQISSAAPNACAAAPWRPMAARASPLR